MYTCEKRSNVHHLTSTRVLIAYAHNWHKPKFNEGHPTVTRRRNIIKKKNTMLLNH